MKQVSLEWNVLQYDFNLGRIVRYNVLEYSEWLISSIKRAIKKKEVVDYNSLKEFISRKLKARYWSRAEYEIMVSGLITKKEPQKIDVWYQIEMNIDSFVEYINDKLKLGIDS